MIPERRMELGSFEAELRREGFLDVAVKSLEAGAVIESHAHAFDVRALVLEGDITLRVDGGSTRYGPGEVFVMARGREHVEQVGSAGVRYMVGRRA